MKTLLSLIAISYLFSYSVSGQYLSYNTRLEVSGDTAILYTETLFGISGSPCPPLESYVLTTSGNSLELNLYYDLSGFWHDAPECRTYDTVYITDLSSDFYFLKVISNSIKYNNSTDTIFNRSNRKFSFSILNTQPNFFSQSIFLYPNPTTEAVTINFNGATTENRAVEIMDMYGRLVEKIVVYSDQTEISIPVKELPAGLYFCALREGNTIRQLKFVKQ